MKRIIATISISTATTACRPLPPQRIQVNRAIAADATEVTVGSFKRCIKERGCDVEPTRSSDDDINTLTEQGFLKPQKKHMRCTYSSSKSSEQFSTPANCVSGSQAEQYCEWAGGRLPTPDEWVDLATEGGTRRYPWGDQPPTCETATISTYSRPLAGCGTGQLRRVRAAPAGDSARGLSDLIGNVAEWTYDPSTDMFHAVGGSFLDIFFPETSSSELVSRGIPRSEALGYSATGFRCVYEQPLTGRENSLTGSRVGP